MLDKIQDLNLLVVYLKDIGLLIRFVEYVLLLEHLSTALQIFLHLIQVILYEIYMGVLEVFLLVIKMVHLTTVVVVLIGVNMECSFLQKRRYVLILIPIGCQMYFLDLCFLKVPALLYIPTLLMT